MKKMLKIIAILLVIATVVFAAGCSSKAPENKTTVATENVSESTAVAEFTAEENLTEVPLEENETGVNETELNVSQNETTPDITNIEYNDEENNIPADDNISSDDIATEATTNET
jgi:hypothetical protein